MRAPRRWLSAVVALGAALGLVSRGPVAGQAPTPDRVAVGESPLIAGESSASALAALRLAAEQLDARVAAGQMERLSSEYDALVGGRIHERLVETYRGIRVFGAETTRQLNTSGQTLSIFGSYYPGIAIDTTAAVTVDQARQLLGLASGAGAIVRETPALVVLPVQGTYRLTWTADVSSSQTGLTTRTFLDAVTGESVLSYNDTWLQTAPPLGQGVGVVGDAVTVGQAPLPGGGFVAVDLTRPGQNATYDLKGNLSRAIALSLGTMPPVGPDLGTSPDGRWSGAVASAQAYVGLTMDYYRVRFNRIGIDNHNLAIRAFVNVARPQDAGQAAASLAQFYAGAYYAGGGDVVLGVGALTPAGEVVFRNFAGGLDVVSHELTHGVTRFTSNLVYGFESGALNEAFSDMMGAAVEFMAQPLGDGLAHADWSYGEDVTTGPPLRSFRDPHALGAPDHYSLKRMAVLADDNGGVHANASIVDHMFYLAIMGGTNRVSQLSVPGVGFEHRDEIEKAIYRAFTQMLPANATFAVARAATIQAARDLYGVGSPPDEALSAAWAAVGVN
jgi:bacillolysin